MKLSVLIPVFNEIRTIDDVIRRVIASPLDVDKEIVIVDDGSTDGTREFFQKNSKSVNNEPLSVEPPAVPFAERCEIKVFFHDRNLGKGAALRTAMEHCRGDVIVIQDADLEYDPDDWAAMYELIAKKRVADVVFGSRFYGKAHRSLNYHHYLANRLISILFNILYNQTLTDIETCYKMFTREVKNSLKLKQNDFGIEIEISAQIALARKFRIYEVAIQYFGRDYTEGKKITWHDGLKAVWYLFKFRLV